MRTHIARTSTALALAVALPLTFISAPAAYAEPTSPYGAAPSTSTPTVKCDSNGTVVVPYELVVEAEKVVTPELAQAFAEQAGDLTLEDLNIRIEYPPNSDRVLPAPLVALVPVAVLCAEGALGSIAVEGVIDFINGGEENGDYITATVLGCVGGPIGGAAGALLRKSPKLAREFARAVAKMWKNTRGK